MEPIKSDLKFLIRRVILFHPVHFMHLWPEKTSHIDREHDHNPQNYLPYITTLCNQRWIESGPTVLFYQKLDNLCRHHESDTGINDLNVEYVHDTVHDLACHQWLFFQVNPYHDLDQYAEQEHPPNPESETEQVK